jgi:hypothetical protein
MLLLLAPAVKMFAHGSTAQNEGWNAFYQQDALEGKPLYGEPICLSGSNYPPISFHLIGMASRLTGNINQTGRWAALLSFLLVAMLCGAIVLKFTQSMPLAFYTALIVVVWVGVFRSDRIGMNDPTLLGTVFSLLGLYCYILHPEKAGWLSISALAFAISLFTKLNLLAFPTAVGLHLLLGWKWKGLAIWIGVLGGLSAVFFVLSERIDGPYFLEHLLVPRPQVGWLGHVTDFTSTFQAALCVAVVWALLHWRRSPQNVLVAALITSILVAFAFAGGYGVGSYIFFDCVFTFAIISSLVFAEYAPLAVRSARPMFWLAVLLIVPSAGMMIQMPWNVRYAWVPPVKIRAKDFDAAVQLVKSHPGPALCLDVLVCFEAGKPFAWDPFIVNARIKTGRLDEADVLRLIENKKFSSVEVDGSEVTAPYTTLPSAKVTNAIIENYRVEQQLTNALVLVPKE